jgi:hypothetical protein
MIYHCMRCDTELVSDKDAQRSVWYNPVTNQSLCSECFDYKVGDSKILIGANNTVIVKPSAHPRLVPAFTY